ncbi:hypothetical protein D3C76_1009120 [compost metagenome]
MLAETAGTVTQEGAHGLAVEAVIFTAHLPLPGAGQRVHLARLQPVKLVVAVQNVFVFLAAAQQPPLVI